MSWVKDSVLATIAVIVVVAIVLGIAIMAFFGIGLFSNATANFRGNVAVHKQVNANGNYRIAAYNHFFDLCQSVQTTEAAINAIKAQEAGDTGQNLADDKSDLTANVINRASLINQYNADASEQYTQGQFLASNLPAHLYLQTKDTQCTAQ